MNPNEVSLFPDENWILTSLPDEICLGGRDVPQYLPRIGDSYELPSKMVNLSSTVVMLY